jgi:hypothetical protein
MASQANVYTAVANVVWQTDKVQISTGNTAVTYQVWLAPSFGNSIYSNAVIVPPYATEYKYVGVGNYLTVTGSNFTATESGTASSATAGVQGGGSYVGE